MSMRLTTRRVSLLAYLCMLPFVETRELSVICGIPPASTLRNLEFLRMNGLAQRVPHSMDTMRRTYRWIPTNAGLGSLSGQGGTAPQRVSQAQSETGSWIPVSELTRGVGPLRVGRATLQWRRVMSGRLDILACVYRLLCALCRLEGGPPAEFRLYRSIPYDAAVRLSNGACYGIIVQRPAFGGPHFAKRLGVARKDALSLTATLIVVPHVAEIRTVARTVSRKLRDLASAIVPADRADDPADRTWVEPDTPEGHFSLKRLVDVWNGKGNLPYETPAVRIHPPDDQVSMPPYLDRGAADIMRAVADWPLAEAQTIQSVSGLSADWTKKMVVDLRRFDLIKPIRVRGRTQFALTNHGIERVSAASRTNARLHEMHWSASQDDEGKYVGGMIRQLVREMRHNDMVHGIISSAFRQARESEKFSAITAVPPHRGMKFFRYNGPKTYSIRPDATITVRVEETLHILLVEVERKAVFPKTMVKRLTPYLRYFDTEGPRLDYGVQPSVMVVLENAGIEARLLDSAEMRELAHLPILASNFELLSDIGPFGKAWRTISNPAQDPLQFWRAQGETTVEGLTHQKLSALMKVG